jgi:CheY-like chemotaxis protein
VLTDVTRLRQILVNLVSNAVKFTGEGEIAIRCRTTDLGADRVRLEVAVSDTGIGLTAEQIERIFAPFSQADASTTRRFGGTGLGLSLSQQLAGMLGGEITVRSEPDRGSTFTLTVVATVPGAEPAAPAAVGERGRAEPASPARLPSMRVLLAEDTSTVQRLIEAVLRQAGAEVVTVEDGETARRTLAEAGERAFDVVVMDMQMPTMDGYEATRALRRDGYEGPIVALTARAEIGDRERCLEAGCDAYMSKPLDPNEFVRLVAGLGQATT